ncbi:hypothetical protein PsorP6_011657 [Peronosclerospora sorghi]|uniref:Uncharacterized protein n=1 Tax=Peronosclerospora sorghi TaxID=230839 RepID=A0ACC0WKN0_9STRA|nr:hypothetical protein PsorP6_011657 [Peronosclerospora sorghi]
MKPNVKMEQGGLRSQQVEAERVARELMDLKIEAAHLRERLRLRVGGDTTAAELEAEAFALQTALREAQETLKTRDAALQTMESKYEQAMRGMMRLDEAWKRSNMQMRAAQDAQQVAEQQVEQEKRRADELVRQLDAATQREAILSARVDELVKTKEQVESEREEEKKNAKMREMQVHELRAQLETMRHKFEKQMKEQEGATREDVRKLQEQLQEMQEQAATSRGEIHAKEAEIAKLEADFRDVKAAESSTKQRLVKLTEEYATLRVQLESSKAVALESTKRAIEAETKSTNMQKELKEQADVVAKKDQTMRMLEGELIQKEQTIEDELRKRKVAVEEAEQRLTRESQEMLQAQEETWSCREKVLLQEVETCKHELTRVQGFHVELMQLLQEQERVDPRPEPPSSVEPAMLKALVIQQINKNDVLTSALGRVEIKLDVTKRQLCAQKQLETENMKLRAEYERAKLAMERMALRKAKTFASDSCLQVRSQAGRESSSSEKSAGKENRSGKGEVVPIVKRKVEVGEADTTEVKASPRKAPRMKHVYVASRYLSSASKR